VILLDYRVTNQVSTRRLRIIKYRGTRLAQEAREAAAAVVRREEVEANKRAYAQAGCIGSPDSGYA